MLYSTRARAIWKQSHNNGLPPGYRFTCSVVDSRMPVRAGFVFPFSSSYVSWLEQGGFLHRRVLTRGRSDFSPSFSAFLRTQVASRITLGRPGVAVNYLRFVWYLDGSGKSIFSI